MPTSRCAAIADRSTPRGTDPAAPVAVARALGTASRSRADRSSIRGACIRETSRVVRGAFRKPLPNDRGSRSATELGFPRPTMRGFEGLVGCGLASARRVWSVCSELRHGFSDGLQHSSHQPAQARRHLAVPSRRRVQHVNCCENKRLPRLGQLARTSGSVASSAQISPQSPMHSSQMKTGGITRSADVVGPHSTGPPGRPQHPGDALPAERAASRRAR